MAKALVESTGHPLVVMIDEQTDVDPPMRVALIEVAKHLFEADYIVFVMAVNRSQLTHSIKALYGNDFDAVGYLRRFFDVDFRLPEPNRMRFIKVLLDDVRVQGDARDIVQAFFSLPNLSLRQIGQSIHRMGLVMATLSSLSNDDSRLLP